MDAPARILLIRPSALGDVCRTVPVLATLRAAYPHAAIDWLVQDTFAPAIEHHPALTRAVPFPRRQLARAFSPRGLAAFFDWSACLTEPSYDLVIDAQGLARSGLFAAMTGARTRLGYANAQEGAALFYTRRVRVPRQRHAVERMMALVCEGLGIAPVWDMRLYTGAGPALGGLPPPSPDPAGEGPCIVLAPTSRWPAKRWPAERFAELAEALLAQATSTAPPPSIVLIGAPGERDQCAPLLDLAARDPRLVDLIGRTSISALMSIIERAALVVANDSAALHMAVGFDRPIVALFGPTDVARVGPFGRECDVIQQIVATEPLDHKRHEGAAYMGRITTRQVVEACLDRLQGTSRAAGRVGRALRGLSPRAEVP